MKVTGKAAWSFLSKPKPAGVTKDGIPIPSMYTLNVVFDKATATALMKESKELQSNGLNIKKVDKEIPGIEGSEGMYFLQIKKIAEYEGKPVPAPNLVDSKKQPIDVIVGNGSTVNVLFAAKPYKKGNNAGVTAKLHTVQVIDLVEYNPDGLSLDELDEVDGFVASSASTATASASSDIDELDDLDL